MAYYQNWAGFNQIFFYKLITFNVWYSTNQTFDHDAIIYFSGVPIKRVYYEFFNLSLRLELFLQQRVKFLSIYHVCPNKKLGRLVGLLFF